MLSTRIVYFIFSIGIGLVYYEMIRLDFFVGHYYSAGALVLRQKQMLLWKKLIYFLALVAHTKKRVLNFALKLRYMANCDYTYLTSYLLCHYNLRIHSTPG